MGNPVVHFDIGCREAKQSAAFFKNCFGWNSTDYGPNSLELDTETSRGIQGYVTALGHEPHHYVMIYIEVEDAHAAAEKIVSEGGKILVGPREIPDQNRSFAWFQDVDGNTLGLIEP